MTNKLRRFNNHVIKELLIEVEPAAEWLRTHPPGAQLPDELEPGNDRKAQAEAETGYAMDEFNIEGERIAWDRAENDYCERGTHGCSVHHTRESECQTW